MSATGGIVLFAVTRLPVTLAFAIIGPLGSVLSYALTKRTRTRQRDRELATYEAAIASLSDEIDERHALERKRLLRHGSGLLIGYCPGRSSLEYEGGGGSARGRALIRRIQRNPALPVFAPPQSSALHLGFRGTLASAIRRRVEEFHAHGIPQGAQGGPQEVQGGGPKTTQLTIERTNGVLTCNGEPLSLVLAPEPQRRRSRTRRPTLAEHIRDSAGTRGTLKTELGVELSGSPVELDLVQDGPHALIAGATGSGKSVFLQSLITSLAREYSPDLVQLLLIDFKGGISFEQFRRLPHCLDVLTDLDHESVTRTVVGLGAEMRRREKVLSDHLLQDIADAPEDVTLPRCVIVVDEFATVVNELPELHAVFTDVAARGRALGIHLVIATQRPTGVVKDALAANCSLRVCLRVSSAAESRAALGVDTAAQLAAMAPGHCVSVRHGSVSEIWKATPASGDAVADILCSWNPVRASASVPEMPWKPALPAFVDMSAWPAGSGSELMLGVLDLPETQSQPLARYHPERDGPLLVVGARASGKSNACNLLVSQWIERFGEVRVSLTGGDADATWDALNDLFLAAGASQAQQETRLWVFDDFDLAFGQFPPEYAHWISSRLANTLRGKQHGMVVVFTMAAIPAPLSAAFSGCSSRVLLRAASREQHLMWGLGAASFNPRAQPGRARYGGDVLQLGFAQSSYSSRSAKADDARQIDVAAIVTDRIDWWQAEASRLWSSREPILLSERSAPTPSKDSENRPDYVQIGCADDWFAAPHALAQSQDGEWIFDGCSTAEIKQFTRRSQIPPLTTARDHAVTWNRRDGFRRVRLTGKQQP